ncbi:hypothetical protein CCP2SC5_740007 [Azospirillaceae bacterium]
MNPYIIFGPPIGHVVIWIGEDWYFVPDNAIKGIGPEANGSTLICANPSTAAELAAILTPTWPEPQTLVA